MTAETEFQRRLEQFLDEHYRVGRDQLAEGICLHHPNPFEDYASRTGYLRAIRHIGEKIKEIANHMNGGDVNVGDVEN
jgi:hypothetical protein